jgi:adenylate cyclase
MEQKGFHRKLTAILSADVAGYSRLMQDDETATVKTLETYKQIISDLVKQHRGRVVDAPGDNLLAEFASVVDAVQCAVATQKELQVRNAELPENRKMQFRIGVNIGDVIQEGGRIYGDGVNIAARLESLADPGGICVSKTAFDQIEMKLPFAYEFIGEQAVKNIVKPVGVYRVIVEGVPKKGRAGLKQVSGRKTAVFGLAAALVVVAGVGLWLLLLQSPPAPDVEKADPKQMSLPLPDRPSIVVLPFTNLSEDSKQQLLCDGITDNITNALSKVPELFVIARSTTAFYKGKSLTVKKISEELGVQYVLEGSFQRTGDRVRITVQLVDALTGHPLLTERFDGEAKDIFDLQDDITLRVLNATRVKLGFIDKPPRTKYKGTQGLDCFLKHQEVFEYLNRGRVSPSDLDAARNIANEGLVKCPDITAFYRILAICDLHEYLSQTLTSHDLIDHGIEVLKNALAIDDRDAEVHALLANLYTMKREYDKAIAEGEQALRLDPGSAWVNYRHAMALTYACLPDEAILLYERAIRLNPYGAVNYYHDYATALRETGRLEEAAAFYKKVLERNSRWIYSRTGLTVVYSLMGREEEARSEAEQILKINPNFSIEFLVSLAIFKDHSVIDKIANALRKAGVPEKSPLPRS